MDILSYNPDNSYWDLPSRVYGYVTEIEPEARSQSDSWWLTLECIDADMFDKVSIRNTSYPIPDSELTNISVTIAEFTFQPGEESFIKDGVCEGLWFEFRFSPLAIGKPFEHYWNLFSPPQIQFLKSVREVDSKLSNRLTESTQLNDISDASEEVIDGLLSNKIPDACAIYDVGQGNCNALLTKQDGEASPFVYFDLGGGVLGNTHTYPSKLRDFCFNKKPTIVLSHLDWDHWSSAQRCKEAKTMDWIVPRQQWGHVHKKFLLEINSHGTLNFWPDNLQKISKNGFEIVKCTGRGRNHSGLAMYAKNNSGDQKMLFTGDCSYNKIPDSNSRDIVSAVVPHHGGKMRSQMVVNSFELDHSRLVYSYGAGNKYGHSIRRTEKLHENEWQQALKTADAIPNTGRDPRHICLYWDDKAPDIKLHCSSFSCTTTCQLQFTQR